MDGSLPQCLLNATGLTSLVMNMESLAQLPEAPVLAGARMVMGDHLNQHTAQLTCWLGCAPKVAMLQGCSPGCFGSTCLPPSHANNCLNW